MGGLRVFGRREIEWYPEGSQETLAVNSNEMTERYDVCGLSYEMSFPIIRRGITNKPRNKIDINSIKDILRVYNFTKSQITGKNYIYTDKR